DLASSVSPPIAAATEPPVMASDSSSGGESDLKIDFRTSTTPRANSRPLPYLVYPAYLPAFALAAKAQSGQRIQPQMRPRVSRNGKMLGFASTPRAGLPLSAPMDRSCGLRRAFL